MSSVEGSLREKTPSATEATAASQREDSPERICPNCGAALVENQCKLLCSNRECGYYLSCSDFY